MYVRACVRACVCVYVCACVRMCMCYEQNNITETDVLHIRGTMPNCRSLYTHT